MLSNCIFDVLKNNDSMMRVITNMVVICFQIVSLTYWKTTLKPYRRQVLRLWFAFKLYLWRIEKQHIQWNFRMKDSCDLLSNCIFDVLKNNYFFRFFDCGFCCDLLSNCIFDVLKNNSAPASCPFVIVVICFQIVSLTYWKTTLSSYGKGLKIVVICFQIVSLTYWKTTMRRGLLKV